MAVWDVEITAPSGTTVSRPIVAELAEDAMSELALSLDVDPYDTDYIIVAKQRRDPDGRLEMALNAAEARRIEAAFYRQPAQRRW